MAFNIICKEFKFGKTIPSEFTCEGINISPPLDWSEIPEGTESLALIMEDPDAPGGIYLHWMLFNIPPEVDHLEKNISRKEAFNDGSFQGKNDFGFHGYGGPCPPGRDKHRYFFRMFALDKQIDPNKIYNRDSFYNQIQGNIIDETIYMGYYKKTNTMN